MTADVVVSATYIMSTMVALVDNESIAIAAATAAIVAAASSSKTDRSRCSSTLAGPFGPQLTMNETNLHNSQKKQCEKII